MPDAELYVAKAQYVDFPKPLEPTPVLARSIARAGHPIIARTPQMWAPLTVDYEVEGRSAAGHLDIDDLRAQADAAGVKVDKRWSAARIGEEIAKAQAPRSVSENG